MYGTSCSPSQGFIVKHYHFCPRSAKPCLSLILLWSVITAVFLYVMTCAYPFHVSNWPLLVLKKKWIVSSHPPPTLKNINKRPTTAQQVWPLNQRLSEWGNLTLHHLSFHFHTSLNCFLLDTLCRTVINRKKYN